VGKAPAYQWYTGDWRKDTQVQMACMITRGIWREMLDCMWDAPERGKLTGTGEQLRKLLGCTTDEWKIFYAEFSTLKIGDVTSNGDGVLTFINRRMFRQEQERISHINRQVKYRHSKSKKSNVKECDAKVTGPCDGEVTPPSSSSSSSSTPKSKTYSAFFLQFWEAYPKKKGKPNAFKEWNRLKPDIDTILSALQAQKDEKDRLLLENKFCPEWPDPERWIKNQRWLDEIFDGPIEDRRMWEIEQARRKDEHTETT
jgi:hypothetical protein